MPQFANLLAVGSFPLQGDCGSCCPNPSAPAYEQEGPYLEWNPGSRIHAGHAQDLCDTTPPGHQDSSPTARGPWAGITLSICVHLCWAFSSLQHTAGVFQTAPTIGQPGTATAQTGRIQEVPDSP